MLIWFGDMKMSVWNFVLILLGSLLTGVFTLHHARLQVQKEAAFAKHKEIIYIVLNAALWVLLLLKYDFTWECLFACLVTAALVGLSAVDFEVYEIPVEFNWFLLFLGMIHTLIHRNDWLLYVIGFFTVSGIFLLISLATKGKGMGGGDIKLMATLGLFLGWKKILLVMVLGSVLGVVIHGIVMMVRKKEHMLPFGPYLSLAAYIVLCTGDEIINWYIQTFLTFPDM